MENPSSGERWSRAGIDDNMLAMFDASETKDVHQDALDDRTNRTLFFINNFIFCFSSYFHLTLHRVRADEENRCVWANCTFG